MSVSFGISARAPIESVEGFIRQVLGWREFVNGVYWLRMPEYAGLNALDAHAPVPPALLGDAPTDLACVGHVAETVERLRGLDEVGTVSSVLRMEGL